jgi:diguanylate cyclase (GGDEF)-like protein/PAS domain S-box-containing protein
MSAGAPRSGPSAWLAWSEDGPGRAVIHHAWGIVGVGDARGRVEWVSPSVEAVLGYRPDELVGSRGSDLVHPDDLERVRGAYTALVEQGVAPGPVVVRGQHRSGEWRHLELVLSSGVADPAVQGVVVNASDVTDRIEAEAAASSPTLFRQVADSAPVMLWMTDTSGGAVFFNRRWYEFTGRAPDEELDQGWQAGLHPDDRERVAAAVRDRFGNREPYEIDYRVRTADGSHRRVVDVGVPRYDAEGRFAGHVGTVIDVTDRIEAEAARRLSESRFRALVQNSHDLVSIYDDQGRFVFASPSHRRVLGYEPDELLGQPAIDLLHPAEREEVARAFAEQLLITGVPAPIEHRIRHRDGSWRWIESVAILLTHDPGIGGILVNARDVTDRRRAELLAADEARILEGIARAAPLPVTLDAVAGLVERWIDDAKAVVAVADEHRVLHVAAAPNLEPACVDAFEGFAIPSDFGSVPDVVLRRTIEARRPDGRGATLVRHGYRTWWGVPVGEASHGRHVGAVLALRSDHAEPQAGDRRLLEVAASVTAIAVDQDRSQARLAYQARHDALTGLPNREQALDRLRRMGRRERRGGSDVAVMFLDLDRFKVLNDSVGHDAGDRLLVSMGQRLAEVLRPGDLVARFGGDEFVVVCEQLAGVDDALALADRLLQVARQPFELDGNEVVVTASLGIAMADGRPPEALLRDADAAMYRAKEKGRDRVEVFDTRLREDVVARLDTERELRHALEHGGLLLYFQPVVSLPAGEFAGFEALLRWQHPSRGLLAPAEFLPVAEDSGLMRPIGEWVRGEVCRSAAAWHRQHPEWGRFVTSINVSPAELSDPHLATNIAKTVLDSDIEPALLSFEITERLLLRDAAATRALFAELRELGVLLALDDFGTGYSPLVHLKQLPVDIVKIDRGFVRGLGADPFDDAIVVAVVDLAHQLALASVAMGVETPGQAERLRGVGCVRAQGHWFAAPLPAALAETWAARRAGRPSDATDGEPSPNGG